ncbi:hypothetical protein HMPREF0204_10634 [Chryseobacterium gleum ATCC 35910]|uniref:Uncharacterized protein n=1 Tax=Chryseobacterium gleum ATCC 35910 TaxID=525257 RepID=A0ABP2IVS3_CHRGE|nr:hypothetical protein HMPREF0204_10634 [Chryseobacterium gleum ATCC 35910]
MATALDPAIIVETFDMFSLIKSGEYALSIPKVSSWIATTVGMFFY